MSIQFDKENKIFRLETFNSSYVFFINENLNIQNVYFGKKTDKIDISTTSKFRDGGWGSHYFDCKNKVEKEYLYLNKEVAHYEVTNSMTIDKKGDEFLLRRENGTYFNDFKYVSHNIKKFSKGKTSIPGVFASAIEEGQELEIGLINQSNDIELTTKYVVFENTDTIVRSCTIKNLGKELLINRAFSFNLDLPFQNYSYIHFHGDRSNERNVEKIKIKHGEYKISSFTGRSGHEEVPGFLLVKDDTTLDNGDIYIFNLVYSGNFAFRFYLDKYNSLRIQGGINDEALELHLSQNECIDLPDCIITFSDKGINNATIKHHDFIRNHIIRSEYVYKERPILLNSREGFFFDFNTEKIIEYIKSSSKIGNELFVLDDGWFTNRDNDTNGLGDWELNKEKVDLEKVINTCHESGVKFGLWIEPEMINPGTKLFDEKENFVLKRTDNDVTIFRHQFCLDMSNDEVIDYLYQKISYFLKKYKIDYIKRDHNRHLSDIYSVKNPNITEGTLSYLVTRGVYKLFDRLTSEFPHVLFEGCAGGGARFDLGMLYFTPQIWASDETDPVQRTYIQYGTSFLFPLSAIGAHVSKNPITSYFTKGAIAFFGTYGFEFDPRRLDENSVNDLKKTNELFKKYHYETVIKGDLYHLCDPFESNYFSLEAVNKDKNKCVTIFLNYRKEGPKYRYLKLKGLKAKSKYIVNNEQILTGEYLMNIGLNLTIWLNEFQLELFVIQEVE